MPSYAPYWGKCAREGEAWHPVSFHCLDVAACGEQLLEHRYPNLIGEIAGYLKLEEYAARNAILSMLTLHDVGKLGTSFQNLKPELLERLQGRFSSLPYRVRHDAMGEYLWRTWTSPLARRTSLRMNALGSAIMGHHGRPCDNVAQAQHSFIAEDLEAAETFKNEVFDLFEFSFDLLGDGKNYDRGLSEFLTWKVAGWAVLADWLGSNTRWFPFNQNTQLTLKEYWNQCAKPQASAVMAQAGLCVAAPHEGMNFESLFPTFSPSPLQMWADSTEELNHPFLAILEDDTGSGKTEAALTLAARALSASDHLNGFYVGLPTMATANQIYGRIAGSYKRLFQQTTSLVLAHSASRFHEPYFRSIDWQLNAEANQYDRAGIDVSAGAYCSDWLSDRSKKALLAQVGVGTVDQALLGVLPVRHQSLRLIGLQNKILILDEIHCYDEYTGQLIIALLEYCARIKTPVILLSATLTKNIRGRLVQAYQSGLSGEPEQFGSRSTPPSLHSDSYPLATFVGPSGLSEQPLDRMVSRDRVFLTSHLRSEEEAILKVVELQQQGHCVCWIRNTVGDAHSAYSALEERGVQRLTLFHSRFMIKDRLSIEDKLLEWFGSQSTSDQREGRVLIATQVVEQSLDLDFDYLITDLAPIDLVLQRAGRMRRHKRDKIGNRLADSKQPDGRGEATLFVLGPEPIPEKADKNWYADMFPHGQFVYQNLGVLWRSAELLQQPQLDLPAQARELVEYGYDTWADIPEVILDRELDVDAEAKAERSLAAFNSLQFDEGYNRIKSQTWAKEAHTPTRLGMDTIKVTLCVRSADGIPIPAAQKWQQSELNLNFRWVNSEAVDSPEIQKIKQSMPGEGKFAYVVLLNQHEGHLEGIVQDSKEQDFIWRYDPIRGLEREQEG